MIDKIHEEFFNTGINFQDYLNRMDPQTRKLTETYYHRVTRHFTPEELRIDLEFPVNLVGVVATWCFDCHINIPILTRIAEFSPNIILKLFIKEETPIISKVNGGERIPQVLIFSKDLYYIDRWVERPTRGYQLYALFRQKYGWGNQDAETFKKEFKKAYIHDQREMTKAFIDEFKYILKRADLIQQSTPRQNK